jgi:hypothetical protein
VLARHLVQRRIQSFGLEAIADLNGLACAFVIAGRCTLLGRRVRLGRTAFADLTGIAEV